MGQCVCRAKLGEFGVEFSLLAAFGPARWETFRKIVPRYAAALSEQALA